jgi:uncharacterized protein YaeQ
VRDGDTGSGRCSPEPVAETLELRVAQHPSESPEFLIARVLAYCLECAEGIAFSKGLSDPDEPAILVRDLTGGSWSIRTVTSSPG